MPRRPCRSTVARSFHAKNAIALGAAQDGVQGQGRGAPAPGAGAARSQEAVGRGRPGGIREDPHGQEGPRVLHEVPGAGRPLGPRRRGRLPSARRGCKERRDDRPTQVPRDGERGDGGGGGDRPRRRSQRHRPAEDPVAHVHGLDPGARLTAGRGPAAGEGRRGDERRAVPHRGLPGRPDHAAVRVLRRDLARAPSRRSWPSAYYWDREGARGRVVHDRPVRHGPRGHGGLVPPGRRAQALGGDLRAVQSRPAPGHGDGARRWPDGSGRRSPRSPTTRASRCASPGLGGKVYARAGATRGPHPGRRDLRRARAGRDRRRRVDRAARRHEAGAAEHRALLLLPWLARARQHDGVRLQPEGVRGAARRSAADARSCRRGRRRSTASRTSTRRTRSRSGG